MSETDALSVVCERMPHSSDTTSATEKYALSLSPADTPKVSCTEGWYFKFRKQSSVYRKQGLCSKSEACLTLRRRPSGSAWATSAPVRRLTEGRPR